MAERVRASALAVSGFLWPLSLLWVLGVARHTAVEYDYEQFKAKGADAP